MHSQVKKQPAPVLKKCTLSPAQEQYVRDNHGHMTIEEMAGNLRLNVMKVSRNMDFLNLKQPRRAPVATKVLKEPERRGFFNVERYAKYATI